MANTNAEPELAICECCKCGDIAERALVPVEDRDDYAPLEWCLRCHSELVRVVRWVADAEDERVAR
jgi:hypothetical protein